MPVAPIEKCKAIGIQRLLESDLSNISLCPIVVSKSSLFS